MKPLSAQSPYSRRFQMSNIVTKITNDDCVTPI